MTDAPGEARVVLDARGLAKRFGSVTALDGCDLEARAGEILAVIGDNGAGKSSLIKALSGAVVPDAGTIALDGVPVRFRHPRDARAAGIETVYLGNLSRDCNRPELARETVGRRLQAIGAGHIRLENTSQEAACATLELGGG